MMATEREAFIKSIVADAPALQPDQAVMLRAALLSAGPSDRAAPARTQSRSEEATERPPELSTQGAAHPVNRNNRNLTPVTDIHVGARRRRASEAG